MERIEKIDDTRFSRTVLVGLLTVFFLQMVVVAAAFLTYARNEASGERVEHTHAVLNALDKLGLRVERAETASRGYLLSPDPRRSANFERYVNSIEPAMDEIEALTADNPVQVRTSSRLRAEVTTEVNVLNAVMDAARAGRREGALAQFIFDARLMRVVKIRDLTDQMADREESLLADRRASEQRSAQTLKWVLGIAALLMIAAAAGVFLVARRYITELAYARNRLFDLNTNLESEVKRRTADLQRANEEVQRFAYIVSHDLRSPLVNILGFTSELERADRIVRKLIERANTEAPQLVDAELRDAQEDLPEAIGFIRASTQKMDRLINAILRLSREGRRTLTPELLPMGHVVNDIVGSLRQRADDAGATITVNEPLPDLTSDRVAIEQVFSNIIENAIKYLDNSRPGAINISGRTEGLRAIYEITDNGRGIDPKDHQRIFELFRRSGTQDRAGEGIGLAHVRATVNRLGGYIDVESTLGVGSTFRLNLPITYVDHGVGNE